jgi:protein arginine kinase activator
MLCEICKKRKATVRVNEIQKDGTHKQIHLCDECAKQYGVSLKFSFNELLGNLIGSQLGKPRKGGKRKCPECGLTFEEFKSAGRLGCPRDYEVFKRNLDPLLEKIQGGLQHVGKVPANLGEKLQRQQEVNRLQRELELAVSREEYERAAELRDSIQKLREE